MQSFKDLALGTINDIKDVLIIERLREIETEGSEGPAELANPAVVAQPIRISPGQDPSVLGLGFFSRNQGALLLVFGTLLTVGVGALVLRR